MLQEVQTTKIKPSGSWVSLDLMELWTNRELLYFVTERDIKIRYKQTAIGVLWVILQPVLTTAIFTALFSSFERFDTGKIPYSLFALSGLLIWFFVNTSISSASNSLVGYKNLVTKIYFPRLILPFSATLAGLIDFGLSFLILLVLMIYYAIFPTWQILLAPFFVLLAVLLTISLGTLFSALNVRFRDVKFALPFVLQIWLFTSPIFYPSSILSENRRFLLALNPLTGILEGFRSAVFGLPFNWIPIGLSVVSTIVISVLSLYIFKNMEDDFADVI
ncbi:MAG: ABC transporter permease [Pyrinomonadaceae bacterium]